MKRARYKLAFQTGASAHFAEVEAVFDPQYPAEVVVGCSPTSIRGWRSAAVAGAERALCTLRERGVISDWGRITITDFIGIPIDTDYQDAFAATFVAVARAATGAVSTPRLKNSDTKERWVVVWDS